MALVPGLAGATRLKEIDNILAGGHQKDPYLIVADLITLDLHRSFHASEANADMVLGDLAMAQGQFRPAKTDALMVVGEQAITDVGSGKVDLETGKGVVELAIFQGIYLAGGEDEQV